MRSRWRGGANATDRYRSLVHAGAREGMRVLHVGCGWDKSGITGPLRATCRIIGIDVDPRVATMYHSTFLLASAEALPFDSGSFDLAVCEYVLEHVEHPAALFDEIARVLAHGGSFICLTPNVASYKAIGARLTPQSLHRWMGRRRYGPGHEADMYETLYHANSRGTIERLARKAGLHLGAFEFVNNGPTWFEKVPGVFTVFDGYHRVLDAAPFAAPLRCAIVFEASKP